MNVSIFIARRLQINKGGGLSVGVVIAIAGITLSMIIMILALSIVLGFKNQIQDKVIGLYAPISVSPVDTYNTEAARYESNLLNKCDMEYIKERMSERSVCMSIMQSGVIKTENDFRGIVFKGYDQSYNWSYLENSMVDGEIPDFQLSDSKNSIILSEHVVKMLNLNIGDRVDVFFFVNEDTPPRQRKLKIVGVFNTNFEEFDKSIAISSIDMLRSVCDVGSSMGHAIEIGDIPVNEIAQETHSLNRLLSERYHNQYINGYDTIPLLKAQSIFETGSMYFNWLSLLDTNVVVILVLMACVSGFTLISSSFILILERVKMIGLLKSLGTTNRQISRMFMYIAAKIMAKGVLLGNIIGVGICLIQSHFDLIPLDPEAYYLTSVPVQLNWSIIVALNLGVILLSTMLLLIPTRIISKISPATTMRYE